MKNLRVLHYTHSNTAITISSSCTVSSLLPNHSRGVCCVCARGVGLLSYVVMVVRMSELKLSTVTSMAACPSALNNENSATSGSTSG